jgi:hypothetical protein
VVDTETEGTLLFRVAGFLASDTELLLLLTVGRVTLDDLCLTVVVEDEDATVARVDNLT